MKLILITVLLIHKRQRSEYVVMIVIIFCLFLDTVPLGTLESFQQNRAMRSQPAKEMRWLRGNTGYTLMGIVGSSRPTVKVKLV